MTATTMHFGPEWMRPKGAARPAPSPPLTTSPAPPGNASYSALVTPATHPPPEGKDVAHPFRYSKEEMLRIYKEGGGRGGLGLEVERWEGIVREIGYDPVGLKEMSDAEKKLYSGPLNSEVRRRQSTDFLSPLTTTGLGERPKLAHAGSGAGSPMRERIGSFMGRRRDSTDQMPSTIPRKLSLSNMQGPLASPRDGALPSPRVRPGFDGVLSETWSARRRNAELAKASNGLNKLEKDGDGDGKSTDIQEQEEEALHGSERTQQNGDSGGGTSSELNTAYNGGNSNNNTSNQLNGQLDKLSINGNTQQRGPANPTQPPPGLGDLSSIEWSYLDPQGNVQGPFPADTMQRWHESKYFSNDLLMKRTHLDTEWTPFGVLIGRAGDQPVFLTPLVHAPTPPGLPRLDTVVNNGIPERNQQSPYQPVPTRNLRSSTLDSYMTSGGVAPESPSSSMGGRFASPDPAVFDTRIGGGQQMGFNQGAESRMPFAGGSGQRRATLNHETGDPIFGNRAFASPVAGRTPGVDGIGFVAGGHPSILNDATSSPFGHRTVQNPGVLNGYPGSSVLNGSDLGSIGGMHSNQGTPSRVVNRDPFGKPLEDIHGGGFSNTSSPFMSNAVPTFPQTPLSHFAGQETRSLHTMTPDRQPVAPLSFAHQIQQPFAQSPSFNNAQSPWLAQEAAPFRRPGPFEPNHPTSNNTFVPQPIAHSQSFGQPAQGGIPAAQSPWQTAQPVNNDPWGVASSNLTVANLGQHNEQQRQAEIHHQPPQENAAALAEQPQAQAVPSPIVAPAAPAETSAPQKTRRKSGAQAAPQAPKVPSPTAVKPPSPIPAPPPITAATSEPKVPWAVDDEKKPRTPGGALNLREIQEAEAKKTEARKVAERERERAARAAAANTQTEDFQPFTASWGLPTSQAGAARAKETPAASPLATPSSTAAAPVWTNATKAPVAKKTMKEIQEEEERRKKQAVAKEKESMAATARRGYAETTTKAAAPVQIGGAWTTVGSGGKVSAVATPPAVAAVARPAATPVVSAKAVPTVAAAASPVGTPRPAAAVTPRPVAAVLKATPSKEDNSIAPGPSLEFLKWMSDSLKGLNSSVNLEDITSMLLSFPLDPDQSTVEIISDLIYASSTTLDGRRFAAEFVSKRKVDAAARPKGVSASGSASKPLSIADVVKAQPKPAQSEWGFKVVNKKKKGGRA